MPIKNRSQLLNNLIQSLLKIEYPQFEIIIIDDNSSDGTKELLRKFHSLKKFPIRIILLKKSVGSAKARNIGIERAKYDIIALTDSDCIVSKNWLKELTPYLEKYDLVGGKVKYTNNSVEKVYPYSQVNNIFILKKEILPNFLNTSNIVFKKEMWLKVGGFLNYKLEDVDFSLRLLNRGYKLVYIPKGKVIHIDTRNPIQQIKNYINYGKSFSKLLAIHNINMRPHKYRKLEFDSIWQKFQLFLWPFFSFLSFLLSFLIFNNILITFSENMIFSIICSYLLARLFKKMDIIFIIYQSIIQASVFLFLIIYSIKKLSFKPY